MQLAAGMLLSPRSKTLLSANCRNKASLMGEETTTIASLAALRTTYTPIKGPVLYAATVAAAGDQPLLVLLQILLLAAQLCYPQA